MAVSLLYLGGGTPWGARIASAGALLAPLPLLSAHRSQQRVPALLLFLVGAASLTLVQLVPVPATWLGHVAPLTGAVVADTGQVLGQPARWAPISLDPPSTVIELAKLCGYIAFAIAALHLAHNRAGRHWLMASVAVVGAALAAIGLTHEALGATSLFGLHQPSFEAASLLSPLLNHNHFAGLQTMAACAAVGLALSAPKRRPLWLCVAALCIATGLLLASRGGAAGLVFGLGVTVALNRQPHRGSLSASIGGWVAAGSAFALLAFVSSDGLMTEFADTRASEFSAPGTKFDAWRASTELIAAQPWTGVGRGAMTPALTAVFEPSARHTYTAIENEYLQIVLDWGLVGALVLLAMAALFAVRAVRGWEPSSIRAGAAGGFAGLLLQNVVDFGLQLPGLVLPALACAAVLTPVRLRVRRSSSRLWIQRGLGWCALAGVVATTFMPVATTAREEFDELAPQVRSANTQAAPLTQELERAIGRHPGDYLLVGLLAEHLYRQGDRRSVAYVNRALLLHPYQPDLHRLAARILLRAGRPAQARLEYRSAIRHASDPGELLREVVGVFSNADDVLACVPELNAVRALVLLTRFRPLGRPDLELALTRRAAKQHPRAVGILVRLADLERGAGDPAAAVAAARAARQLRRDTDTGALLARMLLNVGELEQARQVLREAQNGVADRESRIRLLRALAEVQAAAGEFAEAKDTLNEVLRLLPDGAPARGPVHRSLAAVERALGNKHRADWETQKAQEFTQP